MSLPDSPTDDDLRDDLDAALYGDDPGDDAEPGEDLPDDIAELEAVANRSLGRLGHHQRRLDKISRVYDDQRAQLDAWRDQQSAPIEARVAWYEHQLAAIHAAIIAQDVKRTTVRLPAGSLESSSSTKWQIDRDAFVAWARAQQGLDLVTTVETPASIPDLKKMLTTREAQDGSITVVAPGGEVVPGITATKARNYRPRPEAP